jgi:hypothetical protein
MPSACWLVTSPARGAAVEQDLPALARHVGRAPDRSDLSVSTETRGQWQRCGEVQLHACRFRLRWQLHELDPSWEPGLRSRDRDSADTASRPASPARLGCWPA